VDADPRELRWLRRVRDLCHLLAAERDAERLLPRILDSAIELTGAERGHLVLLGGPKPDGRPRLHVRVARGFDPAALAGAAGEPSRTAVRRVVERGAGLVTTREEDASVLDATSVRTAGVRAIACVPLRLFGETRGVLYLDHRAADAGFGPDDLPLLETFADQAALALDAATPGEVAPPRPPPDFVAVSPAFQRLLGELRRAARSRHPVLILGESGTGKALVARALHAQGSAPAAPFVAESCAALGPDVLESELFGHRRGAFTGAEADREGLFERAGGGTLLLDDVGDMEPRLQAKLLRALQERVVRPLGGGEARPVRCRVLAATHRDLPARVADGRFREDLFYRLDVLRLEVPPLRERTGDVLPLFERALAAEGAGGLEVTEGARRALEAYAWPGNVRQLQAEAARVVALGAPRVRLRDLSEDVREGRGVAAAPGDLGGRTLGEVERAMVAAALTRCDGNKARAARQLGIPRTTLYNLIERYDL